MKNVRVTVLGLWHLGAVTSACVARHFDVTGIEFDAAVVDGLNRGRAPLFEPGLDELIATGLQAGVLRFSSDPAACRNSDVLWLCDDTPVDENDVSDV